MTAALGIWMNGELVAHWTVERSTSTLTYANSWLQSEKVRSLSLSLPITSSRENYSIFLRQGDTYAMTPLYDVISVWPYIGDAANQFRWRTAGLAMAWRAKNAHYALHTIQARHWHALAMKNGGPPVWQAMLGMIEQVEPAIENVEARLQAKFSGRLWEAIKTGMRSQVRQFAAGVKDHEGVF